MAKKREIRTVSFVHIGDELADTDGLDDDQRRRLATWLKTTYLNTLFRGKAEFFESGGEGIGNHVRESLDCDLPAPALPAHSE